MSTQTKHAKPIASSLDREIWLEARRQGVTATEVSKLRVGSSIDERKILIEKITGESVDLSGNKYIDRGNEREPVIAAWVDARFDIAPNSMLFSGENARHLATPDGVDSAWPFSKSTAEIKTSKFDLTEGLRIVDNVLVFETRLTQTRLWTSGYFAQVQWQMHVMGGDRVLFVSEQHDDNWPNPASLRAEPDRFWIERAQGEIDILVELADALLMKLDASRDSGLAPVGDMPSEIAQLTAELLSARDAEAVAKARKDVVWKKMQEALLAGEDVKFENVDASVTVSTTTTDKRVIDLDAAKLRAPGIVAKYEALIERFTIMKTVSAKRLTVTAKKGK